MGDERESGEFVSLRQFEKLEKKVDKLAEKYDEVRSGLRDVKWLLAALVVVGFPNLVTGILAIAKAVH